MSRKRFEGFEEAGPAGHHQDPLSSQKKGVEEPLKQGQRWMSNMEPDLGPGVVTQVDYRRVTVVFHDGATTRIYTIENAPLRRVRFKPGDQVRNAVGKLLTVRDVEENEGLLRYGTDEGEISETDLSGSLSITMPLDRLLSMHAGSSREFDLRRRILDVRYDIVSSPMRGFAGGRIDLIPHQLYIAHEVASRYVRRIMLADEVGLGKTIEACLILHRLLVSGRATQALIIVPEALINVWFVELLRKFNLLFKIFDRNYYTLLLNEENRSNPFLQDSLILTSLDCLVDMKQIADFAAEVDWDMVIIDEAHHIHEGTLSFTVVENLSRKTKDLLLLTATPQQNGEKNHFARLRLLDPSRYTDYERFRREAEDHRKLATITGKLLEGVEPDAADRAVLKEILGDSDPLFEQQSTGNGSGIPAEDISFRQELVAGLLDRHGIGRAMFRNTRSAIGNFPLREVLMIELDGSKAVRESVNQIYREDREKTVDPEKRKFKDDPRIEYIAEFLRKSPEDKLLVICRSKYTVPFIEEALKKIINVDTALFHEDLTLIQRDRNAAYFAEEEGARVLICSEIGSEGRNFQFVHDCIMFDLPADPELVEQRIGRLDRIGQKGPIRIHVPCVKNTCEALLARWYHEGIGIFVTTIPAAQEVFDALGAELMQVVDGTAKAVDSMQGKMEDLILRTRQLTLVVAERLKEGRDKLLEQHSFRPREAAGIVEKIQTVDKDSNLRDCMKQMFKSRGIAVEDFDETTWKLWSEEPLDELFPSLRTAKPVVTFDRSKAIHREEMEFLSIDHPAVNGGIDLYLSSESGNAAVAIWPRTRERGLLLECIFVTQCVAPEELYVDRFLAPKAVRVVVDHTLKERNEIYKRQIEKDLTEIESLPVLEKSEIRESLLPSMVRKAGELASIQCREIADEALAKMHQVIGGEVNRLVTLQKTNTAISEEEISAARNEEIQLENTIRNTAPLLDSLRLIWCPGTSA